MADNFFADYPVEGGGGGGGVTSLNGLTGALTLIAGSGITITPSGSSITIASTGSSGVTSLNALTGSLSITGSGGITITPSGSTINVDGSGIGPFANTALSNLASTAINTDLNPDTDAVHVIGSPGLAWSNVQTNAVSSSSNLNLNGGSAGLTITSTAANVTINSPGITLFGAFPSPDTLALAFYNQPQSHFISLQAPAALSANTAFVLPAADGTSGQFLSTDGAGNLSFQSGGGGGGGAIFAANANGSGGQTIPASVWTTVLFPTVVVDSAGAFNPGTGQYTFAATGNYVIGAAIMTDNSTKLISEFIALRTLCTTGSQTFYSQISGNGDSSGNTQYCADINGIISVTAGDTIQVQVFNFSGGAIGLDASTPGTVRYWIEQI